MASTTVVTAWATAVLCVATILLVLANVHMAATSKRLAQIQEEARRRDSAIIEAEQVRLVSDEHGSDRGILFQVWNAGLRPTNIRDCYLAWRSANGDERSTLRFFRQSQYHRPDVLYDDPLPFIGTTLASGACSTFLARPTQHDNSLLALKDVRVVFQPVVGDAFELPLEDDAQRVIRAAHLRLAATHA